MTGFLTNKSNQWHVRWSDLHSFGHGTHWMFTPLHPEQQLHDIFPYLSTAEYEGLNVDVEFITDGYELASFMPRTYAKIIINKKQTNKKQIMTREDVYTALDSERAYQDEMSQRSDRPDMLEEMNMGDILSAIQYNLTVANGTWYNEAKPYANTTQYLRKIAALCIKAGETFGMNGR